MFICLRKKNSSNFLFIRKFLHQPYKKWSLNAQMLKKFQILFYLYCFYFSQEEYSLEFGEQIHNYKYIYNTEIVCEHCNIFSCGSTREYFKHAFECKKLSKIFCEICKEKIPSARNMRKHLYEVHNQMSDGITFCRSKNCAHISFSAAERKVKIKL